MTRAFAALLAAYAALLAVSVWLLSSAGLTGSPWQYAAALLPVPAAAGLVLLGVGRYRKMDEVLQRIHLMALAVAFFATLLTVLTWGFLEGVGQPPMGGFVVFGLLAAYYLVGLLWARSRYR